MQKFEFYEFRTQLSFLEQYLDRATIREDRKMQIEFEQPGIRRYLCWKRTRILPFVTVLRIRNAAWPEFSGRETLAAASPRAT
jgi:hypothetical protein